MITTDPGLSGREGALLGTESFSRATVGYGVRVSISLIRSTLGDFGQARIGEFFTRPYRAAAAGAARYGREQPAGSPTDMRAKKAKD